MKIKFNKISNYDHTIMIGSVYVLKESFNDYNDYIGNIYFKELVIVDIFDNKLKYYGLVSLNGYNYNNVTPIDQVNDYNDMVTQKGRNIDDDIAYLIHYSILLNYYDLKK